MNGKRVVTLLLLAFVAASVAWLVFRETTGGPDAPAAPAPPGAAVDPATAGVAGATAGAGATGAAAAPAPAAGPSFVAFYFHGTRRCHTCRTMQAYAEEAVRTAFAADLETGRLTWREVNIEQDGNGHFATDFQVTGSTLVVAELAPGAGGKALRYEKLDKTWDYVDDKARFLNYVADEVDAFLAGPAAATGAKATAGGQR